MNSDEKTPENSPEGRDEEELANANIFFNEQLYDDAKKICRKILIRNPAQALQVQVRALLEEIQKKEIQDLLTTGPHTLGREEAQDLTLIRDRLEQDFRIKDSRNTPAMAANIDLQDVRKQLATLDARDMKDWGVAFLEMGAYSAAKIVFHELGLHDGEEMHSTYLLALTLIGSGDFVGATILLEPYVGDFSLPEVHKTDFLYLMGLAFERLGEPVKAREYYRRVHNVNPRYRDVAERIQVGV